MYTSIYNIVIICADRQRIINDENKRLYINIFFIYIHVYYILYYIVIFFLARFVSSADANLTPRRVRTQKKKSQPYSSNTTRRSNDYCCYYYYFTENDVDIRHRQVYRQQYNVRRVCEFGIACFSS